MPIYDYRCRSCRKRFAVFFRSFPAVADLDDELGAATDDMGGEPEPQPYGGSDDDL